MSVKSRLSAIKQMRVIPLIVKNGSLAVADVKSTSGTEYHVGFGQINKHEDYYEYTCTCQPKSAMGQACQGNSNGTVCKHCLATWIERLARKGVKLTLTNNLDKNGKQLSQAMQFANSVNYARLVKGQVICIKSLQSEGRVWGVGVRK